MLEPEEGKLSSPVLRGLAPSNEAGYSADIGALAVLCGTAFPPTGKLSDVTRRTTFPVHAFKQCVQLVGQDRDDHLHPLSSGVIRHPYSSRKATIGSTTDARCAGM